MGLPPIKKAAKKSKSAFPLDISGCGIVGQKIQKNQDFQKCLGVFFPSQEGQY